MLYKDDGQGLDDGKSFIIKHKKCILGGDGFDPAFFFINTSNSLLSFSRRIFTAVAP